MVQAQPTSQQDTAENHYDLVIVGGGMVGAMLAAGLAHTPLRIAVIEPQRPVPFQPDQVHDLRVSALSLASERMLDAVGAWERIREKRCCPFRYLSVEDGEAGGSTEFYSGSVGETHLGHIVENRVIQLALLEQLEQESNVTCLCPASMQTFRVDRHDTTVILDDGSELVARLVIGADGARSKVRELSGIESVRSTYPQQALVATVETGKPQQSITWQRFLPTGPQAFLPLSGHHGSVVWYHDEIEIDRLKSLSDQDFIAELEHSFPAELGSISAITGRASFPLNRSHARQYVKDRVALVGDAAHTVHPLAGQGVNLGLLDGAVLAEVIADTCRKGQDIGAYRHLRAYERWRRSENSLMIQVLDGFYHAFKPQPEPVRQLRSLALTFANQVKPVRDLVTRYAMGNIGDLPKLAKGKLP